MEEDEDEDEDEDSSTTVFSPATKINYDISNLDPDTQSEVRQLFRETPASEPPSLVLQWCQLNQEQGNKDSQFYAFQLHEMVPRSIRIGSPGSKYSSPRCNCMQDSDKPCRHLIYLLDQINAISSDQIKDMQVQQLGPSGASTGMGQPFERISNFHLDLLSSSLHCDVGSPDSKTEANPVRLEETREILATVAKSDADDLAIKHYRNDVFEKGGSNLRDHDIITYDDLTKTVAKMLVTNNDFFAYFLKLLPSSSKARDPFRKIQQHIDRVLGALDAYSQQPLSYGKEATTDSAEGPRDVSWATAHVLGAVSRIKGLLQNRDDAPSPSERASAARTLVQILHTIVFDWNRDLPLSTLAPGNNLYWRLIGSQSSAASSAFVLDTLSQLPEQNQWIETLEDIEAQLSTCGPPAGYMRRLRDLIALMRSSRPAATPTRSGFVKQGASRADATRGGSSVGSKRSSGDGSGRQGGAKRAR
ncbi:hypothetical protein M406DRAFT_44074 [Cryphonectria parasitica EP155]|uniref:SWIM-type domain-containing protein n=1 Tax=Cryphonectria parasitica (strain ATCC 38755 / EP155) TaxID=660469 RepID=A0A9P4Y8H1_CRYP1|nr:uncharacterized protein M406DRAFT_44074 [Cryphonectria parasitica EP155]KAF3768909.1 hypothetical protein M406DRAFT_44074 [Cryphonectria parasitica EP155]